MATTVNHYQPPNSVAGGLADIDETIVLVVNGERLKCHAGVQLLRIHLISLGQYGFRFKHKKTRSELRVFSHPS